MSRPVARVPAELDPPEQIGAALTARQARWLAASAAAVLAGVHHPGAPLAVSLPAAGAALLAGWARPGGRAPAGWVRPVGGYLLRRARRR